MHTIKLKVEVSEMKISDLDSLTFYLPTYTTQRTLQHKPKQDEHYKRTAHD